MKPRMTWRRTAADTTRKRVSPARPFWPGWASQSDTNKKNNNSRPMLCIAVVSIYVLMLLGINVYKSRTIKSDEDFMVAGRGVPVYMLVATLVCT